MYRVIFAVFSSLLAFAPVSAQTPPAVATDTLAAARQLIQTMKLTDQYKAMLPAIIEALKPEFGPDKAKEIDALAPAMIAGAAERTNEIADKVAAIYAENFSADELHEIDAFYRTPTGQKILARQGAISQQAVAAGQTVGEQIASEFRQQIADALRKPDHPN